MSGNDWFDAAGFAGCAAPRAFGCRAQVTMSPVNVSIFDQAPTYVSCRLGFETGTASRASARCTVGKIIAEIGQLEKVGYSHQLRQNSTVLTDNRL
jgi:hypothetical protein